VAITFRQGEGSRTASQPAIVSIVAGVLTVTADLTTALVGDIIELFGTGGNDGFYSASAIDTVPTPDTYLLRPAPADQGAVGNAARLNRAAAYTFTASAITSVTAIPGTALAVIEVAGATFMSQAVGGVIMDLSDRLVVTGSTTLANNGAWYVQEILSNTRVIARPPDGGVGMATQAASGTLTARRGVHVAFQIDEATLTWQRYLDVATPIAAPTPGTFFGSGAISDYIRKRRADVAGVTRTLYTIHGLTNIYVEQAGLVGDAAWTSGNETVFVARRAATAGTGGDLGSGPVNIRPLTGAGWTGSLNFRLGLRLGNRFSAQNCSAWVGVDPGQLNSTPFNLARLRAYGSLWDTRNPAGLLGGPFADEFIASIIREGLTLKGAGGLVESTAVVGGIGYLILTGSADMANLLLCQNTTAAAAVVSVGTLAGLRKSDLVVSPLLTIISGLFIFLNPGEDYDITTLGINSGGAATCEKQYTFNPRFVSLDAPDATPIEISGFTVTIYENNGVAWTQVFTGVTDVNGFLNAGVGVNLRRQHRASSNAVTNFTHRFVGEGGGFRLHNDPFVMSEPVGSDLPVDRISPPYEGEFGE
jgi:hypothetical protein